MSDHLCFSSWRIDAQPYDPNAPSQPVPRRFRRETSFQAIEEGDPASDIETLQISARQSTLARMNTLASRREVTRTASSRVVGSPPAGDSWREAVYGYNSDPSPGGASIGGNTALCDAPSTQRSRFHFQERMLSTSLQHSTRSLIIMATSLP